MMIYIPVFIFIMLFIKEAKGDWKLVWNNEFENQTLDTEKWEIENELDSCHGNYIQQFSCNTNSERNLRLIDGTLAITAIYEKYLNKDYTSGKITTKQGFTYGRFEIRAALPEGRMLRSQIFMDPENKSSDVWAINGQTDIITNIENSKLNSGLHYGTNRPIYDSIGEYQTDNNLNDFHIYSLEWDQFEIRWFLDHINYQTISINRKLSSLYTKISQPFDMPFKLVIYLGVGGVYSKETLTFEDVMNWKCSLLIIDYVRIYEWVNGTEKLNLMQNKASAEKICSTVMPLISLKTEPDKTVTIVISVICSLLLLAVITIIIIVFLLIKQKKQRNIKIESELDVYDDNDICDTDTYDVINTSCEYTDLREETTLDKCDECDPQDRYEKIECKQNTNSQYIYLDMTFKNKQFTDQIESQSSISYN